MLVQARATNRISRINLTRRSSLLAVMRSIPQLASHGSATWTAQSRFSPAEQAIGERPARNRPMTIGDKLWTDKDSRAELETGVVSIHLSSMTALSFLNLDQTITQMRLAEGSINFRVKEICEGDTYEVDTPNAVFTITQAGAFRIDVNENGDNTGSSRGPKSVARRNCVGALHKPWPRGSRSCP